MPFSVRVNAIKAALRKLDINCNGDEDSLTVSAVHSCWGGKSDRVLSPVYSNR